jgi:hypothetical protein
MGSVAGNGDGYGEGMCSPRVLGIRSARLLELVLEPRVLKATDFNYKCKY